MILVTKVCKVGTAYHDRFPCIAIHPVWPRMRGKMSRLPCWVWGEMVYVALGFLWELYQDFLSPWDLYRAR
ncbi:MAG: hypothetical protein OXN17_02505 [Candidatus Poribacteria bacterium]|nr:hypothetical protein [Candidatus Poribacteria bacterium]MDE0506842.1 hypothetical protein [Candidatus Poribacteria bacterium]